MANEREKGQNRTEGGSSSGWEVVYTGFILIMLCFFIMLCSFSSIEKSKVEHFVASFSRAMTVLPGGVKARPGDQARRSLPDMTYNQGEMGLVFQELEKVVGEFGLSQDISFDTVKNGLVIRLADKALFDLGIAEISEEAFPLLDRVGAIISKGDYPVEIRGHTDDLPIQTNKFPSNWELSTARAVNVLRYLLEIQGISAERLSAAGFGEFQPVVPNDTAERRAKNRRVEIIFRIGKSTKMIDSEDVN